MVIDALGVQASGETYAALAAMMKAEGNPGDEATRQWIRDHTLIRRIESFDPSAFTNTAKPSCKQASSPSKFASAACREAFPTTGALSRLTTAACGLRFPT